MCPAAGWSTDQYVRQSFDENPMGNNDTWAKAGVACACLKFGYCFCL